MIQITTKLKESQKLSDGTYATEINGKPHMSTQRSILFFCESLEDIPKAFNLLHVEEFTIRGNGKAA